MKNYQVIIRRGANVYAANKDGSLALFSRAPYKSLIKNAKIVRRRSGDLVFGYLENDDSNIPKYVSVMDVSEYSSPTMEFGADSGSSEYGWRGKYRTISESFSILYGFDKKSNQLIPIKKIKSGLKFRGSDVNLMVNKKPTPMVAVLHPSKKIVGFFYPNDVEKIFGAEGDAPKANKNLVQSLTSAETLWTAGGGAAVGFVLGQLIGKAKAGLTIGGAVLGGVIGLANSMAGERTMSVAGSMRKSATKEKETWAQCINNCLKKGGLPSECTALCQSL